MLYRHMDGQGFIILGTTLYRIQYTKYFLLRGELSIGATDVCISSAISLALLCKSQCVPSEKYLPCLLLYGRIILLTKKERVSPCSLHNTGMDHYCFITTLCAVTPKPIHNNHFYLCSVNFFLPLHICICYLAILKAFPWQLSRHYV